MNTYDVVLLPTFTQVDAWRKRKAAEDVRGLFSQTATTFNAWIADLWELHGDGRAIVNSLQRQMVMQAAFDQLADESGWLGGVHGEDEPLGEGSAAGEDVLTMSPGVVKLAARCARDASGLPVFERAVDEAEAGRVPDGLTAREAILLWGIARYRTLVAQAGFVELGSAAALLAADGRRVFPRKLSVLLACGAPPDWRMEHFFGSCENLSLVVEEAPALIDMGTLAAGATVRFGFPSGRYAQPALVADIVRGLLGEGATAGLEDGACGVTGLSREGAAAVVVACADPLALYKEMEPELVRAGVRACVQAQVPFSSTDFGRQFLSMARVLNDDAWDKDDLSCAVAPPFSGFSREEALEVDKELRQNRLAQRDECLEQLRITSDRFSQFEELAADPEADVLLGVFEQVAFTTPGRSSQWRLEQLSAASALRSCTTVARRVGASMKAVSRVLEDVKVTVSFESEGDLSGASASEAARPHVVVTTQAAAAQMGAGSCGHLVLCDLTSQDYPVADKDDAATTLFGKLGLQPTDNAIARARRTFAALIGLPTRKLVCLRPLNDWDGNPTYPCAMLQELVDAYRPGTTSDDDLDEVFGLPESLMDGMLQRGEELLFANAAARTEGASQSVLAHVARKEIGDAAECEVAKIALARRLPDGSLSRGFSPSPSQVESYLECPHKWFVQSRVRVEMFDEGFGPLERGSFSHGVLQEFYRRFAEAGHAKVNEENLVDAKALMRQVADEAERTARLMEPGSGRYVAANQMEQRELAACKEQLVSYLDFEARFLPTFHPAYLEHPIRIEDGVVYAGHPFVGIVDRIDVDANGNAVVIDYKGSVNGAHEIAGKDATDPGKVQTRMYAQAVRAQLGLNVVGALYVSYGKKRACAGAFDSRVLESAHLPDMRLEKCACSAADTCSVAGQPFAELGFQDMLGATEALVEDAIASMEAGRIQPDPANADVCQYCPVAGCPKRGA